MRAAVYYGNHQLKIEDVPEPTAGAGQVKVRVSRNGICGTDLHEYFDGPIFIPPSEPHPLTGRNMPLVLGHEFSGTVTEVGAGVTDVREGDRVTIEPVYRCGECRPCRAGRYNLCQIVGFHGLMADGGMAECTVVPRNQVHKLPDSVPLEMGALVEPMSVAYHAAVLGGVGDQGSALIFGAGPIGIGIWFALRGMGLTEIDVVEPSPVRRASIEALGARTLNPANQDVPALIAERTGGQGVDAAFDAAGVEQAVDSALQCVGERRPLISVAIGARTSLLLSAPDGTMLWRWSEDSRLSALLDRRSAVVGTRWNEDIVGTNGLGTALETIQPVMINGSEHFSAALHEFTCAGAPIRHPITRRVAGVLSVTSLVRDASPLMGPTLLKLAREVEEQLYSDSTLHERELLHHFLAERRRGRNAVVAVSEDVVIANKAGARLQVDHRALWHQVESGLRDSTEIELEPGGDTGAVRLRTIEHAGSVVGLVIVAEPAEPTRAAAKRAAAAEINAVGVRTPDWPELPALLRAAAAGCDRLLVTGEAGVGKRTLLRETFGTAGLPFTELDCAAAGETGSERWLAAARATLVNDGAGPAGLVVLCHLETLSVPLCHALGRILDQVPRDGQGPPIAATWTPGHQTEPAVRGLLDRFAAEPFEVPPLRKRPGDVLRRLVGQGPGLPALSAEAAEQARLHPWPGNHRQLEEFRRWLGRQNRLVVEAGDLPSRWRREADRARLTTIQVAEADAIAAALRDNGGNKAAAALHLGISRSSLYRKMREYRLR